MQHLDEGTVHAWLDGALSADEAARVDRHTAECGDCAALVAEARGLVAGASRILSALDEVSFVTPQERASRATVGGIIRRAEADASRSEGRLIPTGPSGLRDDSRRTHRWFRPATLAAAASVILMIGSGIVLTKSGGRDSVASRAVPATAAVPTSEADASPAEERSTLRQAAAGEGSANAGSAPATVTKSVPRAAQRPQLGAASREPQRLATEPRQSRSVPSVGRAAGAFSRDTLAKIENAVATAAPAAAQNAAGARKAPAENEKAAISGAVASPAAPSPPPAADVAVAQRAVVPGRAAGRRAAAAPSRSEAMVDAAAAEAPPTARVDTVYMRGRVDTVIVDPPQPPVGSLRARGTPTRPLPVYPVTGCYRVIDGGLSDTLTLSRNPVWGGMAEERYLATARGATGFWSQPRSGDVHIMIRGVLVNARIDPSTGDLVGQVQRGGSREPFLARRCR